RKRQERDTPRMSKRPTTLSNRRRECKRAARTKLKRRSEVVLLCPSSLALPVPLHANPLMRGVRPNHCYVGVFDLPHADVNVLPGVRRVRAADDLVLAGLIAQPITALKQHSLAVSLPLPGY